MSAVAGCLSAPLHAQSRLSGNIALASQLADRGLAITPVTPILQGAVSWKSPTGWSLGLAGGVEVRSPGRPVIVLARISRAWAPSADWLAQANLLYYDYRGNGIPDRADANVYFTYRDALTLGLSAIRVDDARNTRVLGAADASLSWPLMRRLSLSAGAGIAQAVVRSHGPGSYPRRGYENENEYGYGYGYERVQLYGYGNLGLAWSEGPWRLQVDRNTSSLGARRVYGHGASTDWVATLVWSF